METQRRQHLDADEESRAETISSSGSSLQSEIAALKDITSSPELATNQEEEKNDDKERSKSSDIILIERSRPHGGSGETSTRCDDDDSDHKQHKGRDGRETHAAAAMTVGQMKARAAQNRIKSYKQQLHDRLRSDILFLIEVQPTALDAVRLERLIPPYPSKQISIKVKKSNRKDQARLEQLLEETSLKLMERKP